MSMNVGASDDGPLLEINTTPLIDVLLVLLIMLIITLPAMTHAIKLDVPIGRDGAPDPPPAIEVAVDFDNVVVWNGTAVGGFDELEMKMRAASRTIPQPHINVRADRRSKYDSVAHVLAIAQRSGMRHIGIEGTP